MFAQLASSIRDENTIFQGRVVYNHKRHVYALHETWFYHRRDALVIVVIAILASITVVAYSGVQTRSYASAAAASRNSYVKLLKLYRADKGRYPIVAVNGQTVCLGSASDYPAKNGFAANQCQYSDYSSGTTTLDTAISAELKAYGSLPAVNWPPATEVYAGTLANQGATAYVWYFLPGKSTCSGDGYGAYNPDTGETQCTIYLAQ